MDQGTTDTPVPVRERMDGLELGVHDPGLDERRMDGTVHVVDEVRHQAGDQLGWWWDELGGQRMPGRATDPVLDPPETVVALVGQKGPVQGLHIGNGDGVHASELLARPAQDRDVVGHEACLVAEPAYVFVLGKLGERHLLG